MTTDHEIQILAGRLNAGWAMCEFEADPAKRARLEDHWIALLHQYEAMWNTADEAQEATAA